ncbi:MAG TPA: bifunctional 4-hydroxy-2-oxoglutarate aldolase/2-dehydro-3-deoxy-phosphogluconate aldolase [Gemmatimonadales bacterium]|nr:bifunctional 4-hydroxy-2-oxoglutarate aldolase/2-dehydro-3-deoxy-phosphogluconate aldolase [Gemmatimonadales bacterium]
MSDPGLERLLASGVIAVLRGRNAKGLTEVARALGNGGVRALEITLTTPGAVDGIADLSRAGGEVIIGAGTVLDAAAARSVVDAGARFVVSPTVEPEVIRVCRDRNVPCIPGAFTPTEILGAWRAGAALVKLFPATAVGPGFLQDLLGPLPQLRIVPSGGITLERVSEWIRAGAAAVSVGGALVGAPLAELADRARAFVAEVRAARQSLDRSS